MDRRQAGSHKLGPIYAQFHHSDDRHNKPFYYDAARLPAFMTKYEPLCQGGVAKSSPRWRGSWRGSTSKMAKVDLKLHSLLKAWMQAFLMISLSTGWLRGYPPKTSPRNIHANFRIEIQNHTLNVIARIFPRMTSVVSLTPSPWELPQWSVAAPTHPSAMSTTLVP